MKPKSTNKELSPKKREKSPIKKKVKITKPAPDQKMMREISSTKIKQIEKLNNSSLISKDDDAGIKSDIKVGKKASTKKVKPMKAQGELMERHKRIKSIRSEKEDSTLDHKESLKALTQNKSSISKIKDELAKKRNEKEAVKAKIKAEREKARHAVEERRQAEKDLLEQKLKEREDKRDKIKKVFEEKKAEKESEKLAEKPRKGINRETSLAKTES